MQAVGLFVDRAGVPLDGRVVVAQRRVDCADACRRHVLGLAPCDQFGEDPLGLGPAAHLGIGPGQLCGDGGRASAQRGGALERRDPVGGAPEIDQVDAQPPEGLHVVGLHGEDAPQLADGVGVPAGEAEHEPELGADAHRERIEVAAPPGRRDRLVATVMSDEPLRKPVVRARIARIERERPPEGGL